MLLIMENGGGSILMGTECPNTRFQGSLYLQSYVRYIAREAKKILDQMKYHFI